MKKRIIYYCLCFIILLSTVLSGCSRKRKVENIFYLSSDGTSLIGQEYDLENTEQIQMVEELLAQLQKVPDDVDLKQTLPSNVSYKVDSDSYHVSINFSKEYYEMSHQEEVLVRAAIVKTILSNWNYYYAVFYVDGEPLLDSDGNEIGSMSLDSFVENPGAQINSSIQTTLTLYFSNEDGTELVTEQRNVTHSTSTSMERLIMQQLIEGAKEEGHLSTIPAATKIFSIAVSDHVCFVNLDEAFRNQNLEISESVVLYSIVDSLTQLPEVNQVLISINGDNAGTIRFNKKLSVLYERDLSYVENNEEDSQPEETDTEFYKQDEPIPAPPEPEEDGVVAPSDENLY